MLNLILICIGALIIICGLSVIAKFRNATQLLGLAMFFIGFGVSAYNFLFILFNIGQL